MFNVDFPALHDYQWNPKGIGLYMIIKKWRTRTRQKTHPLWTSEGSMLRPARLKVGPSYSSSSSSSSPQNFSIKCRLWKHGVKITWKHFVVYLELNSNCQSWTTKPSSYVAFSDTYCKIWLNKTTKTGSVCQSWPCIHFRRPKKNRTWQMFEGTWGLLDPIGFRIGRLNRMMKYHLVNKHGCRNI